MRAEHIVLIGLGGAGAFVKDASTPNLDRVITAKTYCARTVMPPVSAQCWASLLIGVEPSVHGLDEQKISRNKREEWTPISTIFAKFAQQMPRSAIASFCATKAINEGIVETWCEIKSGAGNAGQIAAQAAEALCAPAIPLLLFVQFDEAEKAGGRFGYGSTEHLKAIESVDIEIGKIINALMDRGVNENTVVIAVSDHGGTPEGGSGGLSAEETSIFLGCGGPQIERGAIAEASILDVPVIAACALGLRGSNYWTGRIPKGVFNAL